MSYTYLGTPYTTPQEESSLCLVRAKGIRVFSGGEYSPPTRWLHKPLLSHVKVSETCVQPFQRYWSFGVFGGFEVFGDFGMFGVLGYFGGFRMF